jgi:hypothetical protein
MDENNGAAPKGSQSKRRDGAKIGLIVFLVVLALLAGWLAWLLKQCRDNDAKNKTTISSLQKKVDDLNKQLAAKGSGGNNSGTSSSGGGTCTGAPTISQTLKDNLAAAVSSQNYAALNGYMASSVNVVIAASEHGGQETPQQAVADMQYLNSATGPWDFNLSGSTLSSWQAHFYKQYFTDPFYAGKAASDQVMSYQFDCNGKVNGVFMAASADLLTQ